MPGPVFALEKFYPIKPPPYVRTFTPGEIEAWNWHQRASRFLVNACYNIRKHRAQRIAGAHIGLGMLRRDLKRAGLL